MTPQFRDVVTRYQPSIIFSDGEWDMASKDWKSESLLAWLFNESPCKDEVVVNDRWGNDCRHKHGGYWTTEYAAGLQDGSHPWEESRGMAYSYGLNRAERVDDYKTGREFVLTLIDLVSRGGNLLLDIGPAADGTIPPLMEQRLLEIGDWLKVNGEAIYGTRFAGRSENLTVCPASTRCLTNGISLQGIAHSKIRPSPSGRMTKAALINEGSKSTRSVEAGSYSSSLHETCYAPDSHASFLRRSPCGPSDTFAGRGGRSLSTPSRWSCVQ